MESIKERSSWVIAGEASCFYGDMVFTQLGAT